VVVVGVALVGCVDAAARHAALGAFPTRRSSDLDGIGGDEKVDVAILVHIDLGIARTGAERAHDHRSATALPADQLGDGVHLPGRDRKSTRLNSSHVKISYAVFCLKKKSKLTRLC